MSDESRYQDTSALLSHFLPRQVLRDSPFDRR